MRVMDIKVRGVPYSRFGLTDKEFELVHPLFRALGIKHVPQLEPSIWGVVTDAFNTPVTNTAGERDAVNCPAARSFDQRLFKQGFGAHPRDLARCDNRCNYFFQRNGRPSNRV